MKLLAKTKKEITLVIPGTPFYIDPYRYRVVPKCQETDRWEGRELLDLAYVNDEATDEEYKVLLDSKGTEAFNIFVNKHNPSAKKTEKTEEVVDTKQKETKQKEIKTYKKR